MPMSLREIARAAGYDWLLGNADPRGVSTSQEEQREIVAAQNEERKRFLAERERQSRGLGRRR